MAQQTIAQRWFKSAPGFNTFNAPVMLRDIFGTAKPNPPSTLLETVLAVEFQTYKLVDAEGRPSPSYIEMTPQQGGQQQQR